MDQRYETERYILKQLDLKNALGNYNYLLHCKATGRTASIDPTDASRIMDALREEGWTLDVILSTHHHADHVGGNLALKADTGCHIVGHAKDAARIPGIDEQLYEHDDYMLGDLHARIIDVSGHTIGHIAYYFDEIGVLFSGDTVFSMGCGRLFEGDAAMMQQSFAKIAALPGETLICAAHEYTSTNLAFAKEVDHGNAALEQRAEEVARLRREDLPTVPVSLAIEKQTSPFFRLDAPTIRDYFHLSNPSPSEVFGALRALRDTY